MKDGEMEGMQTFDTELEKMIRNGTIKKETGLAYSTNANNLALAISDLPGGPPPEMEMTAAAEPDLEAEVLIDGFER
jgi:Tfp pilus assembly ATPase PilU